MAEAHVVAALKDKRAELSGVIADLEKRLGQHRANLLHVDAVLRLFAPEFEPAAIRPKAVRRQNEWFRPGELARLVLDILRVAPAPLTIREITAQVMPRRGLDPQDGRTAKLLGSSPTLWHAPLGPLLAQIGDPLAAVVADGAYDQDRVYDEVAGHSAEAAVVVPPRSTAVLSPSAQTDPTQRDRHIQVIAECGRMGWQKTSGYNARAGAEGAMSRYKRIIGDTLRSHSRPQEVETRIAVNVLNRMLDLGRPESVRAA
jgi:hypothetical protein